MTWSFRQGGADTTVVTAFYTLIYITSTLRSLWFLIPNRWLKKSYTPSAVFAFGDQPWIGTLFNSLLLTMGSLSLFFIFILILVYWADILKKYFHPGERRSKPMDTFLQVAFSLLFLEACNYICFLTRIYSSEGMILFNSLLLATVSSVCVFKITMFSKKFSTVLKTLGDINQVSTESQVKRIRWITVTGNLFFFLRALVESIFGLTILFYWAKTGNVQDALSHKYWDSYILLRHVSELMILFLVSTFLALISHILCCYVSKISMWHRFCTFSKINLILVKNKLTMKEFLILMISTQVHWFNTVFDSRMGFDRGWLCDVIILKSASFHVFQLQLK